MMTKKHKELDIREKIRELTVHHHWSLEEWVEGTKKEALLSRAEVLSVVDKHLDEDDVLAATVTEEEEE